MPPIYNILTDLISRPWYETHPEMREVLLDCTDQELEANDIVVLFSFAKKVVIHRMEAVIGVACGSSVTFDVGHYTDAGTTAVALDSLLDGFNGNAAAGAVRSSHIAGEDSLNGLYLDGETATKYVCAKILGAGSAVGKVLFRVHFSVVHGI